MKKGDIASDTLFGKTLSLTATLVNESRARRSDISGDIFAPDWIPPHSRPSLAALWNDYCKSVYPLDDIVVSVRNRFFSELIQKYGTNQNAVIILLACGLTSYPYILTCKSKFIEYDFPHVITYKSERAKALTTSGILPVRHVDYIGADISDNNTLQCLAQPWDVFERRIIIAEGLSYYLPKAEWQRICDTLAENIRPGDVISFDFWQFKERERDVYKRYARFCRKHEAFKKKQFTFYTPTEIAALMPPGQSTICTVDEAETRIFGTRRLRGKDILRDTIATIRF